MKLLSITVPSYNSEGYLASCLDSLLQGGDRVEIIVINDGSKDRTGAIADEYAAKYPGIVKAVHQENGGHGEGINQGLKHATGKYFKVVDSDDHLSKDMPRFLDLLEECERQGGVDLFVTNYFYTHSDGIGDRSITYGNALPKGKIFGWEETKPFLMHQLLTIHSCTFRTEMMKNSGMMLPKHVFYEDNLMVCSQLPYIQRMYYMDADLYLYTIGREGQSVQEDMVRKRYTHQLLVAEECFKTCHLDDVKEPHLKRYLKHELFMMFGIATMFTRLNKSAEADANLENMWANCRGFDEKYGKHFQNGTLLWFINRPGKYGQDFAIFIYHTANKIVRFN